MTQLFQFLCQIKNSKMSIIPEIMLKFGPKMMGNQAKFRKTRQFYYQIFCWKFFQHIFLIFFFKNQNKEGNFNN